MGIDSREKTNKGKLNSLWIHDKNYNTFSPWAVHERVRNARVLHHNANKQRCVCCSILVRSSSELFLVHFPNYENMLVFDNISKAHNVNNSDGKISRYVRRCFAPKHLTD